MVAQLYFTPAASGEASYIAAYKAGLLGVKLEAHLADWKTKAILSGPMTGSLLSDISPKGNEPTLTLDDGTVLTEGSAILQWIADQSPESGLAPAWGTSARFVIQCHLNYIASELHPYIVQVFSMPEPSAKALLLGKLVKKLEYLSTYELNKGKKYLLGGDFTIADAYLYVVLNWLQDINHDLGAHPILYAYWKGISELDFVKAATTEIAALAEACGYTHWRLTPSTCI